MYNRCNICSIQPKCIQIFSNNSQAFVNASMTSEKHLLGQALLFVTDFLICRQYERIEKVVLFLRSFTLK